MTTVSQTWSYFIIATVFALLLTLSIVRFVFAVEEYRLIKEWGSQGTDNGQFHLPYSIAIDSTDKIYVVDKNNDRVQKFDNDGNFITKWASIEPAGIAIDSSDNVYLAGLDHV